MKPIEKSYRQSLSKILKDRLSILFQSISSVDILIVFVGIVLALALRYSLRTFESLDYLNHLRGWYLAIKEYGLSALGQDFSDYTPLLLYFYYGVSVLLPKVATITAIKLPSIAFDFICAWYVYRIVCLKYGKSPVSLFAFFGVLFAPTVVLNGAAWGQIESIYTAALVAFIYYLLKKQNWLACICFGIAFAVKFQSVYLAPLLFALLLRKMVSWKHLLTIPVVYLISIIPACLAGRPFMELLSIYPSQVAGYAGLVHNAPNMYAWLPADMYYLFYPAGMIFAASICFLYMIVVFKSRVRLSSAVIIQLAMLSALIVPYFLPKTHDRYFFPADVLSIVFGFYYPEYYYIPLAINLISFFIYQPFLFGSAIFPQPFLALSLLVVIIIVVRHMMIILYKPALDPQEDELRFKN